MRSPYMSWTRDVTNMVSKLIRLHGGVEKKVYYVLKGVCDGMMSNDEG